MPSIIKSTRGKDIFVDDLQYMYVQHGSNKSGAIIYWECSRRKELKCSSRLHTKCKSENYEILQHVNEHNHASSKCTVDIKAAVAQLRTTVTLNKCQPTRSLVASCLSDLDESSKAEMTNVQNLSRSVRKWKQDLKESRSPKIPSDRKDFEIPSNFRTHNSVPDLSDRVSMDSSGMVKSENISVGYTCTPMVTEDSNNPSGSGQRLQDNRGGFYNQYNLDHANMDVKPEPIFGIHSEVDEEHAMSNAGTSNHSSPSPRHPSPSPQGLTGPYLLKKETHCNTILDELLRDETYTDVTLTAEGQTIKAHRIILSLSSKYFKTVLSTDANAKNVIVFRDMKFQELKDIIGFIYTGEVTVDASDLDSFMKTADILEVTSLCNSQKNFPKGFNLSSSTVSDHELPKQPSLKRSNPNISQSPPSKARKASAGTESTTGTKQSKRSIKHLPSPVISPPVATPSASINDPSQTNDEPSEDDLPEPVVVQADCILRDLDEPEQSLDPAPSNECCAACSSTFEDVDGLFQHLEEFHNNQDLFPCEVCVRIFLTAKSFNKHRNYCKPKMKTSE